MRVCILCNERSSLRTLIEERANQDISYWFPNEVCNIVSGWYC